MTFRIIITGKNRDIPRAAFASHHFLSVPTFRHGVRPGTGDQVLPGGGDFIPAAPHSKGSRPETADRSSTFPHMGGCRPSVTQPPAWGLAEIAFMGGMFLMAGFGLAWSFPG
jgi:hypothetical protein